MSDNDDMGFDLKTLLGLAAIDPGWFDRKTAVRAETGDREAALDAIQSAVSGLATGTLSRELAWYLAQVLARVVKERDTLNGDTFIRAFNLKRDTNRPAESRTQSRDWDIAVWVHIAQLRGLEPAEAKGQARALFAIENIDRILRGAGPVGEVSVDVCNDYFVDIGKPLPPRQ